MSNQFKVGDKVYCPSIFINSVVMGTLIHTLIETTNSERPLGVRFNDTYVVTFMDDGAFSAKSKMKLLHHATPANKCLLEKLHGVEFESPEGFDEKTGCCGYVPRGSD